MNLDKFCVSRDETRDSLSKDSRLARVETRDLRLARRRDSRRVASFARVDTLESCFARVETRHWHFVAVETQIRVSRDDNLISETRPSPNKRLSETAGCQSMSFSRVRCVSLVMVIVIRQYILTELVVLNIWWLILFCILNTCPSVSVWIM